MFINGSLPKKTAEQKRTTRMARKVPKRVLEMRKPGPVTVYDLNTYQESVASGKASITARPVAGGAVASRANPAAVDAGSYADALNVGPIE